MNIYDTKPIRCAQCDKMIGEIDYNAHVIRPLCGQCYDPKPDVRDNLLHRTKIPTKVEKLISVRNT